MLGAICKFPIEVNKLEDFILVRCRQRKVFEQMEVEGGLSVVDW